MNSDGVSMAMHVAESLAWGPETSAVSSARSDDLRSRSIGGPSVEEQSREGVEAADPVNQYGRPCDYPYQDRGLALYATYMEMPTIVFVSATGI